MKAARQPEKTKSAALYILEEKLTRNTTLLGQKVRGKDTSTCATSHSEVSWQCLVVCLILYPGNVHELMEETDN